MNITTEELNKLLSSKNEPEWNATCDEIKSNRGGQYPSDWYTSVVLSGLMGATINNFE